MLKEGLDGLAAVVEVGLQLTALIAFGHESNMNGRPTSGPSLLKEGRRWMQGYVGCYVLLADVPYEDVVRIDGVLHCRIDAVVVVVQFDGDIDGLFGVGHQEHILERLTGVLGLVGGQPP